MAEFEPQRKLAQLASEQLGTVGGGKVLEILGAEPAHEAHNNHNYAAREEHFGRTL
jgi:hypothetical protein